MEDIRQMPYSDLLTVIENLGEKKFRAQQVYEWLWKKGATQFDDMTNLSKNIRETLKKTFEIHPSVIEKTLQSKDETLKALFRLHDENVVEGVLIPAKDRVTACISSQSGCVFNCRFCSTGQLKLKRNLETGEIFDQVYTLNELSKDTFQRHLSNIVYMGMGEPLMNFNNVLRSIHHVTSADGLGFSPKRITLSTVGVPRKIKQLADADLGINLAISLHSADEKTRTELIPVNKKYSLRSLKEAVQYFHKKTDVRITYEYILLKGINDHPADADKLIEFARHAPCKVNIIVYNETNNKHFRKSDRLDQFVGLLEKGNVIVNTRASRGKDIDAACGQLAGKARK